MTTASKIETRITEEQLPFRIKRKTVPRIVYGRKPGNGKLGHYHKSETEQVYIAPHDKEKGQDIEQTIAHEIAHYQLEDRRKLDVRDLEHTAENELQADLLAYVRTGKRENYYERLLDLHWQLVDKLATWEVPQKNKQLLAFVILHTLMKGYERYLPPQWKADYDRLCRHALRKNKMSMETLESYPLDREFYEQKKLPSKLSVVRLSVPAGKRSGKAIKYMQSVLAARLRASKVKGKDSVRGTIRLSR